MQGRTLAKFTRRFSALIEKDKALRLIAILAARKISVAEFFRIAVEKALQENAVEPVTRMTRQEFMAAAMHDRIKAGIKEIVVVLNSAGE